jgi:hypothetical protein
MSRRRLRSDTLTRRVWHLVIGALDRFAPLVVLLPMANGACYPHARDLRAVKPDDPGRHEETLRFDTRRDCSCTRAPAGRIASRMCDKYTTTRSGVAEYEVRYRPEDPNTAQIFGRGVVSYSSDGMLRISYEGIRRSNESAKVFPLVRQDMFNLFSRLWRPACRNELFGLMSPEQSVYSGGHALVFRAGGVLQIFYVRGGTHTVHGLTVRSNDGSKARYEFKPWRFNKAL